MTQIVHVPVAQIVAGLNDRTQFNRAELQTLADSIAVNGLIQPPSLRALADGTYQIMAGERRVRAMRDVLGWATIPALVLADVDNRRALSIMGTENRARVQLNPMDEAAGYRRWLDETGGTLAECAAEMGASLAVVKDRLLLLNLCDDVADLVKRGIVSVSYGQAIGRANLSRNFQNLAADALARNPAPTLAWFGAVLDELISKQSAADSMFDLMAYTVDQLDTVQAAAEPAPPLPDTHDAPAAGATPAAILRGQIAYWQAAATAWDGRGKPQEAKRCRAAASSLNRALTVIAALEPAPAPSVAPSAPVTLFDAVVALVGVETTVRSMDRDTVTVLGLNQTGATRVQAQIERAGYSALVARSGDTYRVVVTPAPAPQPSKGRRPMAARLFGQTANQLAF